MPAGRSCLDGVPQGIVIKTHRMYSAVSSIKLPFACYECGIAGVFGQIGKGLRTKIVYAPFIVIPEIIFARYKRCDVTESITVNRNIG